MGSEKFKVLLVEDDYLDALITKRFLTQSSSRFDLTHISDGLEAIDYLLKRKKFKDATRPDLILLDL